MLFLLILTLGAAEIILAVYARNTVASAVHEGARAAVELGRNANDATDIARSRIMDAAGGLLEDVRVDADLHTGADGVGRSRVTIDAAIRLLGPIPITLPVRLTGSASGQRSVP